MMYGYGNMFSPSNRLFSGSGASPLWNGLLAYYTADNTPNDALGTYNGTLVNGATYGTGIINNGFSLDGVNDYVDMGNVLDFDGSTPFSISTWVYIDVLATSSIISKSQQSPYPGYGLHFQTDKCCYFTIGQEVGNWIYLRSGSALLTVGSWHNIIITYDGSKLASGVNIFINGISQTLVVISDTFTGTSSTALPLEFGRRGTTWFLNGSIDETAFWNRVLTIDEVTELYNSGAGKQY